jgi:hypothetical protein
MKVNFAKVIIPTALGLLMAGCAQVGPPLPPSLELPKPVTDLRATRKGNVVTLNWTQPTRTMDRLPVRYLGPTLVCRKVKSEFTTCENIAAELPAPASVPRSAARSKKLGRQNSPPAPAVEQTYSDTLPSAWLQLDPSVDVIYAVEVMNRHNRAAGLSNLIHVPAILTLPPPNDLSAELSGDGVALSWTSTGEPQGAANTSLGESGKSGKPEFRYRIYRRDESSAQDAIAGEIPIEPAGAKHFTDSGFEWEKTFLYRIIAVSVVKRSEGEVAIEGDDSPAVRVVAHDVFPPSVPSGLQAAYSGEGQKPFVDLIWAPVTSADLAGYNVYRSDPGNAEAIVKLNSDLVKSPSYRDPDVVSGKTYTYSVSAVDVRGNESQRSEPASEAVP